MCGERISGGRGEARRVGRRDWRMRRAVGGDVSEIGPSSLCVVDAGGGETYFFRV